MVSAGRRDKMKRLSVVFQSWHSSAPFSPAHSSKIWKSSLLLHIFLWRDMKWAHIINISIRFDCTPNKSHCSNKHTALLLCLPLSGFKLLTLHLTIYYRHLSQVTDKHCDGCMILLCQNGFISPLQATISTELMSWAYSLSSDLLSFPLPFLSSLRWQPLRVLSSKRTHFTRNKCILLFTDLVIYALCGFFYSFQFICQCLCVCFLAPAYTCRCRWVYKHMHLCVCPRSVHSIWAELKTMIAFSPSCCFTLLFSALDAISCYLETQLSIISIIAGKLQSAFDLLLIFFLLVTLKWIEIQRSRNYSVCLCVCVWVWQHL